MRKTLNNKKVLGSVRVRVRNHAWDQILENISDLTWDQVREPVRGRVGRQVEDQVRDMVLGHIRSL